MMRLFTGMPLPAGFQQLAMNLAGHHPPVNGLRWTRRENLHVTSYFIGETAAGDLEGLKGKIGTVARRSEPIGLVLDRISLWPVRKPYMIWAVFKENGLFTRLNRMLEQELSGTQDNGPVIPHVTLARFKDYADMSHLNLSAVEFSGRLTVDHIILFESKLSPQGPSYHPLVRFPLGIYPPHPESLESR
ncbi:MAG: RNA 2',3'-cyclic phosphodiesterase [Bacteroidales bacterium]